MKPRALITFTVRGNQEDLDGNPVPWTRTTARQKWKMMRDKDGRPTQYARYLGYKNHILAEVLPVVHWIRENVWPDLRKRRNQYYLDFAIQFAGKIHGDTGNIIKGFEDALFPRKSKRCLDGPDDLLVHGRLAICRDCADRGFVIATLHGPYPRDSFSHVDLCEFDL